MDIYSPPSLVQNRTRSTCPMDPLRLSNGPAPLVIFNQIPTLATIITFINAKCWMLNVEWKYCFYMDYRRLR